MAIPKVITAQTGGLQFNGANLTKYSMFVGGVNATHHALENYSPAMDNYVRLFMVRPPYMCLKAFGGDDAHLYSSDNLFIQFKHMLEYMNRSITGIGELTMEAASTAISGGYANRQFNTPTVTRDTTTEFTVGLYELNGMPVLTVVDGWTNFIGDMNSGYATYGGWISGGVDANGIERRLYRRPEESDEGIPFNEANHSAEFIAVLTDRSGAQAQKAIMLADCWPKGINYGNVMNQAEGAPHNNITYEITFNCVVYRSPIITAIANDLLKQYRIVTNSLNFNPELGDAVYAAGDASRFNKALGPVPIDSATGTDIGNVPVFRPTNTPKTVVVDDVSMDTAKLSGQPGYQANPSYNGFAN